MIQKPAPFVSRGVLPPSYASVVRAPLYVSTSTCYFQSKLIGYKRTRVGNTGLGTTWYLAEGYTGLTFGESVSILNPGARPSQVWLELLPFGGRRSRTVAVNVGAHSHAVVDVRRLMPRPSLSLVARSSQPGRAPRASLGSSPSSRNTGLSSPRRPCPKWSIRQVHTFSGRLRTRSMSVIWEERGLFDRHMGRQKCASHVPDGPLSCARGRRTPLRAGQADRRDRRAWRGGRSRARAGRRRASAAAAGRPSRG